MPKSNFEYSVAEFHRAYGSQSDVVNPDFGLLELRSKLIAEESKEVRDAFADYMIHLHYPVGKSTAELKAYLAKELADLLYVTFGAFDALGMNAAVVFNRVHRSNMSKLGEDGKPIYREDGKVLKGPNYQPPFLEDLFE